MRHLPHSLRDLGTGEELPRQNPSFAQRDAFDEQVQHVWSLCDGLTSVAEILALSRLGTPRTSQVLVALRRSGAILLPGETPTSVEDLVENWNEHWTRTRSDTVDPGSSRRRDPTGSGQRRISLRDSGRRKLAHGGMDIEPLTAEEARAVAEQVDLSPAEKRRAIAMRRLVADGDEFAILGVEPGVTRDELRRAYRERSKEFHPDRHYARHLGSFAPWLETIFQTINEAYAALADDKRRAELEAAAAGETDPAPIAGQSRQEHAEQLFERACDLEMDRHFAEALRLFCAAARTNPTAATLRRAALCGIRAGELELAEEFAQAAIAARPRDPSYLRVQADVLRAQRRLDEAESILQTAVELATGSEALALELRYDLAHVHALLRRGQSTTG
jgi:DnaJ-domain-containing protein 1